MFLKTIYRSNHYKRYYSQQYITSLILQLFRKSSEFCWGHKISSSKRLGSRQHQTTAQGNSTRTFLPSFPPVSYKSLQPLPAVFGPKVHSVVGDMRNQSSLTHQQ